MKNIALAFPGGGFRAAAFDPFQKDALSDIAATGQFTTCYTLLKYYLKQSSLTVDEAVLIRQLTQGWCDFNIDPFILYKKLG